LWCLVDDPKNDLFAIWLVLYLLPLLHVISSFFWFFSLSSSWHQYFFRQAVGYNSIEAEDWELATNGEEMSKLEALLLDKNRKMEHELTQLKVPLVWMLEAVVV
jgi:hypothetical protein